MTETVKKARTATTNKFQIAANIEKWFERLATRDRPWMLEMLQVTYGRPIGYGDVTETAGPDRIPRRDTD